MMCLSYQRGLPIWNRQRFDICQTKIIIQQNEIDIRNKLVTFIYFVQFFQAQTSPLGSVHPHVASYTLACVLTI